jgi:streptogramin lyase
MRRFLLSLGLLILSLCLLPLLTGCGVSFVTPNVVETQAQNGAPIQGSLQGGHKAIVNSHIHLLAAGATGYGSASTSLLTVGTSGTDTIGGYVTPAADGTFSISGAYTCAPGQQLYLLATGGNSQGDPNGPSNPSIALAAALGVCPGSGSLSSMNATINEVSTVAFAYALSPFATDATHIGASGTPAAYVGIENAFRNVANLVDSASGTALNTTPAGNGVAPQAALNTLANILAACIDTNGTTPPTCSTLFSLATSDGTSYGTRPTDTATAAINIAHHPASNVAALYALGSSGSPFSGSLSAQPSDLTLTLAFTTNTPYGPNTLAIDAGGDVWFPYNNGLSGFTSTGAPLPRSPYTDSSLNAPQSIAIDANGDIWLANYEGSSYTKFTSTYNTFTSAAIPGLNYPSSVAIDPAGDVWFANFVGNSLIKLSPSGSAMGTFPSSYAPLQVISDTVGNLWTPNPNNGTVAMIENDGSHPGTFSVPSLSPARGPQIAALDSTHTLWLLNQDNSISAISATTGAALPGTPFNLGTSAGPVALTLDGGNSLWTLNQVPTSTGPFNNTTTSTLSGFTHSGKSLFTGHTFPYNMTSLAVDGSGNLWIASPSATTVYEIVGLAAPVVTPISVATAHNTLATRP